MAEATIRAYLDALEHELRYDPALSRRVRAEVETHLLDVAASRSESDAIARFGAPHAVAADFAAISLAARVRTAAQSAVGVFVATFLIMQLRLAWYDAMHWPSGSPFAAVTMRVLFALGLAAALLAVAVAFETRTFEPARTFARRRLEACFALAAVTASYVLALLLTDGCATAVRLAGRHWSSASFVPLAALVLEALLAWVVVAHLRVMLRARRLLA